MSCIIEVDAKMGYAPLALERGLPALAKAASTHGVAVMKVINSFHFAALWPETEYLAEQGLVGLACTAYKPAVAPAGATEPFFGTNPISFAWPRPGHAPVVYDMATATLAKGDVQIAARDGHDVPLGTGLGPDGQPTTDPAEILKGVMLPFGGYKGSAIALMVELLCSGLTGDHFSYEAEIHDVADGGPAKGGEFILAMSPKLIAGEGWEAHCEAFFDKLGALEGVRLPGARRHNNRTDDGPRALNLSLLEKIRAL
jgi:delta1-piperideine-2-carboxylate reductase